MRPIAAFLPLALAFASPAQVAAKKSDQAVLERADTDGYREARVLARGAVIVVLAWTADSPVLLAASPDAAQLQKLAAGPELADVTSAKLAPFLGRKDVLDLTVTIKSATVGKQERHYLVRVASLENACTIEGSAEAPKLANGTRISQVVKLVLVAKEPFTFSADLVATIKPAKGKANKLTTRRSFVLPDSGTCTQTSATLGGGGGDDKPQATRALFKRLERAYAAWSYDNETTCPATIEDLKLYAEAADKAMVDAWGTPLQLVCGEQGFSVQSAGPDTAHGTADDLR